MTAPAPKAIQPGFERMLHSLTCPRCQAAPGSHCVTTSGRKAYLHQKRVEASVDRESRSYAVCVLRGRAPAGMTAGDEVLTRYVQLAGRRTGRLVYSRIRDGLQPSAGQGEADAVFVRWATDTDLLALPGDARR